LIHFATCFGLIAFFYKTSSNTGEPVEEIVPYMENLAMQVPILALFSNSIATLSVGKLRKYELKFKSTGGPFYCEICLSLLQ